MTATIARSSVLTVSRDCQLVRLTIFAYVSENPLHVGVTAAFRIEDLQSYDCDRVESRPLWTCTARSGSSVRSGRGLDAGKIFQTMSTTQPRVMPCKRPRGMRKRHFTMQTQRHCIDDAEIPQADRRSQPDPQL
ncbi:hypothetical protein [Croceicoccus sp. YJ47]|uniref:hypothetical protein n=1 Tax=Croceicoccus sp. YJ47 TaxID=2798724 RepID=UPI0019241BD7|nr:hypothetical protein [Croceicoccus sp. YJ47]QQN74262.1 hypothetical protein JD971_00115 [Croceicoccus sp. YJ47]